MDSLQSIAAYCRGELKGEVLQQFEERLESNAAFAAEVADYQRTETIGKYLNGELKEVELKLFEAQLASDEELAAEVKEYEDFSIYQDLGADLQLLGKQLELEGTLKELSESYKKELEVAPVEINEKPPAASKPSTTTISRRLWIVAAIAAVLAMVFFLSPFFRQSSPEILYADNIETYKKVSFATKGSAEELLIEGSQAYNQGKYKEAIEAFKNYLNTHPNDNEVKRYMGIAYLELAQPNEPMQADAFGEAMRLFESLGDADKNWYLALAYLKQGNIEKTEEFLLKIEPHNVYYKKAKNILSKL